MEERFVLDNNNNVIDFEDKTDKYCLSQEDVYNVLNKQHQQIKELEQELAKLKEMDNYHSRYELAGVDETIINLQKQLEEKDKEIERLHKLYKDRNNQCQSVRQRYHLINSLSLEELKWLGVKANFESKKIHNFYYNQLYEIFMPNFRWK